MNMDNDSRSPENYVAVSRFLSRILRHEPEIVGILLDGQGWVSIDELIRAIERAAHNVGASKRLKTLPTITRDVILAVVATNDKQRFSLSPDGLRIRAAQGHSIVVDLGYAHMEPPAVLYHGTAWSNWESIAADGLTPRTRHAVHLSTDVNTATRVGARHGQPLVLVVDAARMRADGYAFSRSDNGVWLTELVPAEYLAQLGSHGPTS
ncbi:putative RNA 2'-phosphotransferase [Paraburkholderia sp. BL27I4N3]|uniref:RNA 2'-phosphotransferase n=1 Tax=Paraburkholderia sp. BL27I4N3 TaxID=1938805 RepID=UPI000E38F8F5|nr:RNA 2'-phosphotransferase [Paraburkholderia sp. BL27I4N3]REE17727.1 putative RNA 2'-phosphotransferase [Paraburkholderia sp. BL27I4N3]